MKIYKHAPVDVIRISITKGKEKTMYLSLIDTTAFEVEVFIKDVVSKSDKCTPWVEGLSTSITIREAKGGKNGKSKSLSFRGLSPQETYDLLVANIEKNGK